MSTLICIVDDDDDYRDSADNLLRSMGFVVLSFASARAFLDSPVRAGAALLLLDITMPDMTGPELLEFLLQDGDPVPVVFVTAEDRPEVRRKLLALGALAVLQKPMDIDVLLSVIPMRSS